MTNHVRTGEPHGFPEGDATSPANQYAFKVGTPSMDWAAKALQDAQDRYFKQYPTARRYAHALIWPIEKVESGE